MLGLCKILFVCVCVCVGVDYLYVLLRVVLKVIVSMCGYDDTCATLQIWGCFLDIGVAMYIESRDRQSFDGIIFFIHMCTCV